MKVAKSFTIERELIGRLADFSEKSDRTLSWVVGKALEEYLDANE